jgi:Tfp pilus assembly protein PilO
MKNIFSILIILISVAVFVFWVRPQYVEIGEIQDQSSEFDTVISNARKLQELRDDLIEKRNQLSNADLDRLQKLIPENSDNVKLILELQELADLYGLQIRTASSKEEETEEDQNLNKGFDIESKDYGIITLNFNLTGGYDEFISFLAEVERKLRITDITSLSFSPLAEDDARQKYDYQLGLQTYWLKDNI